MLKDDSQKEGVSSSSVPYIWKGQRFHQVGHLTKLMRSNQGQLQIQSKSYSKWLLINIFNPNSAVWSIVATISIQIRTQIWIQISILNKKLSNLMKNCRFWSSFSTFSIQFVYFRSNSTIFDIKLTIFDWIIDIRSILIS